MQKIRILGPRDELPEAIGMLQDIGSVHLCPPQLDHPVRPVALSRREERHVATVKRALDDIAEALARLGSPRLPSAPRTASEPLIREVRLARRVRRAALALEGTRRALVDEIEGIRHSISVLEAIEEIALRASDQHSRTFYLVLTGDLEEGLERLRRALVEAVGEAFVIETQPMGGGELAVALVVAQDDSARIEALLPHAAVREVELPGVAVGGGPPAALHSLRSHLADVERELAEAETRRAHLAAWVLPGLMRAQTRLNDWLVAIEALCDTAATEYLFVIEGWLPESERSALDRSLGERRAEGLVVEEVAHENWSASDVPVAIRNPRFIQPFEVVTRWLPLPRYGTIDPTPFVAVFFPMFFGLILGDLGYGALLAAIAAVMWSRSKQGGVLRSVAEVAAACAAFAMVFGLVFGEFFGDLGRHLFGMRSIAFEREEAFVPFLVLAVSLGFVHVLLGLILGAFAGIRSDPRGALGRALSAVMLVLTAAALLAALQVLPQAFFTPAAVALLLSFPVLIALEGLAGAVEFLSRISNVLSYARIMALGTASVMLAVVANELVGTMGGAIVGVVFATLFHLVNFGLAVFSPTIHALRLHFVEFFGTFYSPGGIVYHPLKHWRPADEPALHNA